MSGYVGRIPSDPEDFTGWSFKASCPGCGRGMVDVWLMTDGRQVYRPHKYVPRDPATGAFMTGTLVDCPKSGELHR